MQTFRPYYDHRKTARVLDERRLGKQRIEAKQIGYAVLRRMGVIRDGRKGWLNHPIVLKWFNNGSPYLFDLKEYFAAIVCEWVDRGHKNTVNWGDLECFSGLGSNQRCPLTHLEEVEYRRVLIFKNPEWYTKRFNRDDVEEVLCTEPVYINGVNGSLFRDLQSYRELERRVRRILDSQK